MVFGLIQKIFGKSATSSARAPAEAFDYEGYQVQPAPIREDAGWRVAGFITKEIDGEIHRHEFIRADVVSSAEEAVSTTAAKARRVIDEQGERIFRSSPASAPREDS